MCVCLVGDYICVTRDWILGQVEWSHTRHGEVRLGLGVLVESLDTFKGNRKSGIDQLYRDFNENGTLEPTDRLLSLIHI